MLIIWQRETKKPTFIKINKKPTKIKMKNPLQKTRGAKFDFVN
jgi:hypothetical protein